MLGLRCYCLQRAFSTSTRLLTTEIPVITVPKYLEASIRKHERAQDKEIEDIVTQRTYRGNIRRPVITSKSSPKLNFYFGQSFARSFINRKGRRRLLDIPLCSQGWMKGGKYRGDIITFHRWEKMDFGINEDEEYKSIYTFDKLFLSPEMVDVLTTMGFTTPSSAQQQAIPQILNGSNVILSSEAGSGKTIAYLAPIIQMVLREKQRDTKVNQQVPRALIIAPGRELTEQIGNIARKMSFGMGIGVTTMLSGGSPSITQTGHDIIVTTAGLAADLAGNAYPLDRVQHLVLDEADTLFDDSFNEGILEVVRRLQLINKGLGKRAQVVLVGATMPAEVDRVMGDYVGDTFEKITTAMLHRPPSHVKQSFLRLHKFDRDAALLRLVSELAKKEIPTLIFSSRTKTSNWVRRFLDEHGIHCLRLNKTVPYHERADIFEQFQNGSCDIISCTDVASRGLDTQRVRHVINFECPFFLSDYLHRAGRTGRLGSKGTCEVTTFVSFKPDVALVQKLEYSIRTGKPLHGVESNLAAQMRQFYDTKYQAL